MPAQGRGRRDGIGFNRVAVGYRKICVVDGRWTKVWSNSSESLSRCATNQMEQALPDMPPNKIAYFRNQLRLKVNMRRSLTVIIVKGTISYQ